MGCPDFIIAGAMRAGTTALASALGEHAEIFMATPKEPSFFAVAHGGLDFRGPGDQGFARDNISDWESYRRLFRDAGSRIRGEASAMYLSLPGVAADIRKRCPDVKIVIILRDPIDRAFSAWQYLRGQGREDLRGFTAGLVAEPDRRACGYGPMWWYVEASRYQIGLEEYFATFPKSQLLVFTTEELRRHSPAVMLRVCEFLGVDGAHFEPTALRSEVNRSGVPRVEFLSRLLYPSHRVRAPLSRITPPAMHRLVRRARVASLDAGRQMPSEARQLLRKELAAVGPEVRRLAGLDTHEWQTGDA
jgi:hypothetical protein